VYWGADEGSRGGASALAAQARPPVWSARTKVAKSTLDPRWSHRVLVPAMEGECSIVLSVADYDMFSKAEFLGQAVLHVPGGGGGGGGGGGRRNKRRQPTNADSEGDVDVEIERAAAPAPGGGGSRGAGPPPADTFARLDRGGKGHITAADHARSYTEQGIDVTQPRVVQYMAAQFAALDTEGTGRVTRAQYAAAQNAADANSRPCVPAKGGTEVVLPLREKLFDLHEPKASGAMARVANAASVLRNSFRMPRGTRRAAAAAAAATAADAEGASAAAVAAAAGASPCGTAAEGTAADEAGAGARLGNDSRSLKIDTGTASWAGSVKVVVESFSVGVSESILVQRLDNNARWLPPRWCLLLGTENAIHFLDAGLASVAEISTASVRAVKLGVINGAADGDEPAAVIALTVGSEVMQLRCVQSAGRAKSWVQKLQYNLGWAV
jgi:hypothetical protein